MRPEYCGAQTLSYQCARMAVNSNLAAEQRSGVAQLECKHGAPSWDLRTVGWARVSVVMREQLVAPQQDAELEHAWEREQLCSSLEEVHWRELKVRDYLWQRRYNFRKEVKSWDRECHKNCWRCWNSLPSCCSLSPEVTIHSRTYKYIGFDRASISGHSLACPMKLETRLSCSACYGHRRIAGILYCVGLALIQRFSGWLSQKCAY